MTLYILVLQYMTIVILLLSLVFALGVIWRTEKKLDTTYKLVLAALLSLLGSKGVALSAVLNEDYRTLITSGLEFLAVFFLLLSILEMRVIVRLLSHEVKNKK